MPPHFARISFVSYPYGMKPLDHDEHFDFVKRSLEHAVLTGHKIAQMVTDQPMRVTAVKLSSREGTFVFRGTEFLGASDCTIADVLSNMRTWGDVPGTIDRCLDDNPFAPPISK